MSERLPPGNLALSGVRVLDLTWILAGPACTKFLADQGAEVIKFESKRSMDPVRQGGPWLNRVNTAPDGGGAYGLQNRNKLSANLNLQTDEGKALFTRLVAMSDVVVDNYSAGTMERMGLGYGVLSEVNPRIVMAELSSMGQEGPYSRMVGFGQTLMALSGNYELTGYPDGPPMMPAYTYADFAAAATGAMLITAALHWRRTSGLGQYIDLGQIFAAASLAAESQLEALVNGSNPTRQGNHEPGALLHGCYRCAGDDEWCVVAVWTDEEWGELGRVLGRPEAFAKAGREVLGTARYRAEAEAALESWTSQRSAYEVMRTLQAAGIEAAKVQSSRDLMDHDPHLRERGFYEPVEHFTGATVRADGVPFRMSDSPARVRFLPPVYGADNDYVFGTLLALPPQEIQRLEESGVIG